MMFFSCFTLEFGLREERLAELCYVCMFFRREMEKKVGKEINCESKRERGESRFLEEKGREIEIKEKEIGIRVKDMMGYYEVKIINTSLMQIIAIYF